MKTSRILNDESLILGLDRNDLMGLAAVYFVTQNFFSIWGKDYLSVVVTIFSAIGLMNIRLKYRRKIIRDTLRYFYYKAINGGIYSES
jgi:hypothetical protein